MADKTSTDWSAYWRGRAGTDAGAALVGAGVETDAMLASLWAKSFAECRSDSRVLDLACGAGSALKAASAAGLSDLTGVDISPEAIETLRRDLPGAQGIVAPADSTGLPGQSFDMVVSQFGFEYAGPLAGAREAARLLKPEGRFVAIAHLKGGAIEQECTEKLTQVQAIIDTQFVSRARKLFKAVFAAGPHPSENAMRRAHTAIAKFKPAMEELQTVSAAENGQGLATHLYTGTAQLYERRQAYLLEDVLGWLDGMEAEIVAFSGRMSGMINSALSPETAEAVLDVFRDAGFASGAAEPLELDPGANPAAWQLSASA